MIKAVTAAVDGVAIIARQELAMQRGASFV
jgi:hypothetical protein